MSYIPQSGIMDTIKSIGSGAASIFKGQAAEAGKAEAYRDIAAQQIAQQQYNQSRGGGLPSWALPVGIGAAALVLFIALKKK